MYGYPKTILIDTNFGLLQICHLQGNEKWVILLLLNYCYTILPRQYEIIINGCSFNEINILLCKNQFRTKGNICFFPWRFLFPAFSVLRNNIIVGIIAQTQMDCFEQMSVAQWDWEMWSSNFSHFTLDNVYLISTNFVF